MSPKIITGLILFLIATGLFACGGGGGGSDAGAGATITLTPSKAVALADGNDTVTVHAGITKEGGASVDDGTAVTFTVPDDSGNPSVTQTTTTNGLASITLTRDPIQGANNMTETVTAASAGLSESVQVKFINQPASADVLIKFDQAVTNLAGLQFNLNNTAGATFDNNAQPIATMNSATAGGTAVAGNFDSVANRTRIILAFAGLSGFNTGTAPIIKATFAVSAGLPAFSVDVASAATFTAIGPDFGATTPLVTATNVVVTVTYNTEN